MYRRFFKRVMDLLVSTLLFVAALPLLLLITLVLLVVNSGKPFFLQKRPGRNGDCFTIIKFRTMNGKKAGGELLPDSERLTSIGNLLRSSSLDEIPQLVNVIKGDMSLVGPRPLLPEYLPLYNDRQRRRHEVRPGITGLAQVNGRNLLTWQKKLELDVYYVDHLSFKMDCKILRRTFIGIFRPKGIRSPESATMERFTGNALF
jgi:undecaprenyl phosphate N,N'-diacetylbacillosamine 1-phosphate transferase